MNILGFGSGDFSFIERDLCAARWNLCAYLRNCIDGYASVIPNQICLFMDGIPNYIIVSGVATEPCDLIVRLLAAERVASVANKDDCLALCYDAETKSMDIFFSPPPGEARSTVDDFVGAFLAQFGRMPPDGLNRFLHAKNIMYMLRFGNGFPPKFLSEDPMEVIDRINVCLYNGEPADMLAWRYRWVTAPMPVPAHMEGTVVRKRKQRTRKNTDKVNKEADEENEANGINGENEI